MIFDIKLWIVNIAVVKEPKQIMIGKLDDKNELLEEQIEMKRGATRQCQYL
jgi:hypothetical protein